MNFDISSRNMIMGLHDHIYSQGSERILLSGVSGTKPSKYFGNLDRQRLREREREKCGSDIQGRWRRPCKVERTAKIHLQGDKT